MSVNFSFNANVVDPNTMPEPVPTGRYPVTITKSEEKEVNGKAGQYYLEFTNTIMDGEYKGRTVKMRLNHKNESEQARNIASGELSAICHVTGVMSFNATGELHNKPFMINVIKVPNSQDPTREYNEVRGVFDSAGNPPKKGQAGGGAADASQAAAFGATGAQTTTTQTATTAAPATTTAAPAVTDDGQGLTRALADGWLQHPGSEPHFYKGQEVKLKADVAAMYPAPVTTAPAIPAAPAAPAIPDAPAAPAANANPAVPSWAQ